MWRDWKNWWTNFFMIPCLPMMALKQIPRQSKYDTKKHICVFSRFLPDLTGGLLCLKSLTTWNGIGIKTWNGIGIKITKRQMISTTPVLAYYNLKGTIHPISIFLEIDRLETTNSSAVIKFRLKHFVRHRIPEVVISSVFIGRIWKFRSKVGFFAPNKQSV